MIPAIVGLCGVILGALIVLVAFAAAGQNKDHD